MWKYLASFCLCLTTLNLLSCTSHSSKPELWIYTSLFKETIADLEPKLTAAFPQLEIRFFQAGSEEVAAKINAEFLAGGTKADLVIFSDRFWFEEMAQSKKLHPYKPHAAEKMAPMLKNPEAYYTTLSIPVMVMIYNSEAVSESAAPKSFKEMADPKWKDKFTTGSPLSSGTNFTTVAFLQKAYGWDYFKALRKNETISEGGNSSVVRRVQTKERPIGWVLLENALRLQAKDPKIKIIYPSDGVVIQSNVMAITKKQQSREQAEKVVDWLYGTQAQESMTKSYMYSPLPGFKPPQGAPTLEELMKSAPAWTTEFLHEIMNQRESIKEEFTHIMFQ